MSISKARKHVRDRKKNFEPNKPQPNAPVAITGAAKAGSVLTLTFDQAIYLDGVPQFTTNVAGADPVSAVKTAPNVVAITFDAAIAAATSLNLPFRDPAIRNAGGGYVTSSTFPLAA